MAPVLTTGSALRKLGPRFGEPIHAVTGLSLTCQTIACCSVPL
jgi:hypothetical protein